MKGLYGDALVTHIENAVEAKTTHTSEVKLLGTGNWLDLADIEDKYKNKKERLAGILKKRAARHRSSFGRGAHRGHGVQ